MGFSNSGFESKRIVRIMGLKEKDPHFLMGVPGEGATKFNKCEGQFKAIKFKDIAWSDEKGEHERRVFSIILTDNDGEFEVQTRFTSIGRNLLNCLISCKPEQLTLSLYINKKGYPSIGVFNNGELLGWKLSWEEQEKLTKITDLPDGTKNYYRGDLEKKLEEYATNLNDSVSAVAGVIDDIDEDLPF